MKLEDIQNTIIRFFENTSRHSGIDPNQDIMNMGFINSLMIMQLILFIEKEYDITVDNDVLGSEEFHTICGISNYIYSKLERAE